MLAASVPESVADLVAAEAKARGMTIAQMIRVTLTQATDIMVAKESDWIMSPEQRSRAMGDRLNA